MLSFFCLFGFYVAFNIICQITTVSVFFLFQSNYSAISATCNTWRNYKDVQDSWDSVRGIIVYYMNNIGNFSEAAKPGAWNDPDMVASYSYLIHTKENATDDLLLSTFNSNYWIIVNWPQC